MEKRNGREQVKMKGKAGKGGKERMNQQGPLKIQMKGEVTTKKTEKHEEGKLR
jgi:hypothetical protein